VARGGLAVLHLPPELLQAALGAEGGLRPSGILLRSEVRADRPLLALAVRDLLARELAVVVLKRRLGWVVERRAVFGALPSGAPGGLPERLLARLGVSADREGYTEAGRAKREGWKEDRRAAAAEFRAGDSC
jgi:hypothetical protein